MSAESGYSLRSYLLIGGLIMAVLLSTWMITGLGPDKGAIIALALIGGASCIYTLVNFEYGFYAGMVLGHLIFLIDRMFGDVMPTALMVDLQINATFVGLLIHKVAGRETFFKKSDHTITYAYILYTCYLILEAFNPQMQSYEAWFFVLRKFIQFVMIYVIGLNMFTSIKKINFFMKFWGACTLVSAGYGCYQQWFGLFEFEMNWIWAAPGRAGLYMLDNGDFRKFSILSGPAAYGILMGACALLYAVLGFKEKSGPKRVVWFLITLLAVLGMAYAGTRTAYLIFVAGAVLYILMTITNRSTMIVAGLFFMGFVVIMWGPIYGNTTVNRIRSAFDTEDASLNVRDVNREMIQPYIHEHPMGGGLATSGNQGLQYSPGHRLAGFPPDSGFVKTAVETGWIGLFLQCLLYCLILLSGVHAYYRTKDKQLKIYCLAALVTVFGFVISQYGQVSIGQIPDCFLFYSMLAMIVRISKMPEGEKKEPLNEPLTES
ncbi:MAG: O-antigen ligase domain-containing protein [Chitinophagaceae bacterium]|nr:MAG: O-antigen ligase domain-containing protein [Chitinophagaceae bacterium]